jgi:hypothetical protein
MGCVGVAGASKVWAAFRTSVHGQWGGGVRRDGRASKPHAPHGDEPRGAPSAEDRAFARAPGDVTEEAEAAEEQGSDRRMPSGISHSS